MQLYFLGRIDVNRSKTNASVSIVYSHFNTKASFLRLTNVPATRYHTIDYASPKQ